MPSRGANVLYISYDGLTDPLGRSQILPYLVGLSRLEHRITLLTCEKPALYMRDGAILHQFCEAAGIVWKPTRYHSRPPVLSSAYDAAMLRYHATKLHEEQRFDIVHCRSYIPAISGLALKRRYGVRFLFDMRGFWPDEKVEGNSWRLTNPVFRSVYFYFKKLEGQFLEEADHIISLTEQGRRQLFMRPKPRGDRPPITVIPCCVDFAHFPLVTAGERGASRARLGIGGGKVLAYLGSLGTWYMLDEMLDFFRVYGRLHPDATFLFVTHDDPQAILTAARARGIDEERLAIRPATREEVPVLMAAADLGIFFITPVFSKKASSPTKMGEMLALGLPIVTNSGVGDVAEIVEETRCGVTIERFDDASYTEAIRKIDTMGIEGDAQRRKALRWFDVELGIARYDEIYRELGDISLQAPSEGQIGSE